MYYLDYAATTPISENVIKKITTVMKYNWGNPSSIHDKGNEAQVTLEDCRATIAKIINARAEHVFFTSGASEGNSWVLESLKHLDDESQRRVIISSRAEHASVINKLKEMAHQGYIILYVEDFEGDSLTEKVKHIAKYVEDKIAIVSLMLVNNETGNISELESVYSFCKQHGILLHTDATQAMPHMKVTADMADIITCSAHKFFGPKGIGFVYSKYIDFLSPLIYGGKQERYLRGGTQNLPAIAGMTVALEDTVSNEWACQQNTEALKKTFMEKLNSEIDGVYFHSDVNCIPTINLYIDNVSGEVLNALLNKKGLYVSTSSACSSGATEPSHVLQALGYSDLVAANSIRISFSSKLNEWEIEEITQIIKRCVEFLRGY